MGTARDTHRFTSVKLFDACPPDASGVQIERGSACWAATVFSERESLAAYSRGTLRGARRNFRRVFPRSP